MNVSRVARRKPLQAVKLFGILLTFVLGIGGFFRVISANQAVDTPLLADTQLLALILIPLTSFGLVIVVLLETIVTAYRSLRSDESLDDQLTGRIGYVLLRGAEASVAVVGVAIMVAALPVLFAESTPAPVGVGAMLLLMVVGLGILLMSFIRSVAEIFVYSDGLS